MPDQAKDDLADWPLAACGDQEAFGRVFDRHADLVYRFARRRSGDIGLAEDITAQVFTEAWRQRSSIRLLDGSLRSWLLGVAANLLRRHWRKSDRERRAIERLEVDRPTADPADEVADRIDDERALLGLRSRISSLPRSQVEVLLLWAWEQLSYEEIAAVVGIPVGTVRSRLSRARQHLKEDDGTRFRLRAFRGRKAATAKVDLSGTPGRRSER